MPRSHNKKAVITGVTMTLVLFTLFGILSGGFGSPQGPPELPGRTFAIVFDAGSSGSRVHVFQFKKNLQGNRDLEREYFEQLKPGLSSYGPRADLAAASLTPLLDYATSKVPQRQRSSSPVIVRATAGLRMLKGEQAEQILNAVAKKLGEYEFKLYGPEHDVQIMDGADEGAYAWLAVNFLLKKVGRPAGDTVSTIDLGGGSTQIAYATRAASHLTNRLKVAGQTYHIFTHSYLGFGLNAARDKVTGYSHGPCLLGNVPADLAQCTIQVSEFVIRGMKRVRLEPNLSTPQHQLPVFVLSYVYDVAEEMGLLQQPLQKGEPVLITLADFEVAATKLCSLTLAEAKGTYPAVAARSEKEQKVMCFDLVYIAQMLQQGYRQPRQAVLHAGKSIELNGDQVETQWPLGASLLLS